ncbi:large ribosomal subunit protein mL54-like [Physella acuta]|uniref:large ribosomal subunit protein mL54-like n=1 Tax=Physella acuta TaxID=109671 RepID=UPI0027DD824F|nr:large ribosomal subunit protein mL54-like [Physella acuta]
MAAALRRCYLLSLPLANIQNHVFTFTRSYAKKIVSKVGAAATAKKVRMEVETDPEKLINFCCGANINVDGKDPEIKPDSEYPDWLWNLRLERKAVDLSQLDPNTQEYWTRLSRISFIRNLRIQKRLKRLKQMQFSGDKVQ